MAYTTIDDPTIYFNTKIYTGNGSNGHAITGVGFQPDWVWIKGRSVAENHNAYDFIRGAGERLMPNLSSSENTKTDTFMSFDSDGFTLDLGAEVNDNLQTFVAWNWLATGSTASNSNGDITSTVSANTTAGFSIVSYTGTGANATVGHGLGAAPSWIIIKGRSFNEHWQVYHKNLGATKFIELSNNNAATTNSNRFNNTDPTASVFTIGTKDAVSKSSGTLIAYCFAEKQGYSKFGQYVGNGNADGTFVHTGFEPSWIMIKRYDGGSNNWLILDNKRDPINEAGKGLFADTGGTEATGYKCDFLSNGFKFRLSGSGENGSGNTYLFMAFAESPFVNSNSVPNNAK